MKSEEKNYVFFSPHISQFNSISPEQKGNGINRRNKESMNCLQISKLPRGVYFWSDPLGGMSKICLCAPVKYRNFSRVCFSQKWHRAHGKIFRIQF